MSTPHPSLPAPKYSALFFDAGGTLIHADPPPGVVYAEIGLRFHSRIDPALAAQRFRTAFSRRSMIDLTTSEAAEDAFWRSVVAEVLDDVADFENCYRMLWEHFARPEAWRVDPAAGPVLEKLAQRGIHLGVCSNFDSRLRSILAKQPMLAPLRSMVISSEIGWRKPSASFFQAVQRLAGIPPEQILIVGDDPVNDYQAARSAGLAALLLDPYGRCLTADRIGSLWDLLRF